MQKLNPPDLSNLPDFIDPSSIPGIEYYLEVLKEPDHKQYSHPNHSKDLTVKGFVKTANALAEPFGKAWAKSTELMYGKRQRRN